MKRYERIVREESIRRMAEQRTEMGYSENDHKYHTDAGVFDEYYEAVEAEFKWLDGEDEE